MTRQPVDRDRVELAATGLGIGWMLFQDQVDDPAQLRSAVLDIAFELAGGPAEPDPGPAAAAGNPAEPADQPDETDPGPAWPAAAVRTNGSTR